MQHLNRDWLQLLYTFRGLLSDAVILRAAEEMGRRPEEVKDMLRAAAWAWEAQEMEDDPEAGQ
jgi:hypothetical protein